MVLHLLRIGYGVAGSELIQVMEPLRPAFNTTAYAHAAAVAAIDDQEFVQKSSRKNREELEKFEAFCKEHDLFYYPSQTNFILIDFGIPGDEIFYLPAIKGLYYSIWASTWVPNMYSNFNRLRGGEQRGHSSNAKPAR